MFFLVWVGAGSWSLQVVDSLRCSTRRRVIPVGSLTELSALIVEQSRTHIMFDAPLRDSLLQELFVLTLDSKRWMLHGLLDRGGISDVEVVPCSCSTAKISV